MIATAYKIMAVVAIILFSSLVLYFPSNISDESDAAEVIMEGDLTPTARYRLMDDYSLYFEGTGAVTSDCTLWIGYVGLIREIHISDGITEFTPVFLGMYTSLSRVYAGKDLTELRIDDTPIEKIIFPNGCGNLEMVISLFENSCALFLYRDELEQISDQYAEVYIRLVPSSEVPESVRDFVRYDRVYEVYMTDVLFFSEESQARVVYGDPTIPMTVYHLLPTYMVAAQVDYFCTFDLEDTGYFVLHIDVPPLIPQAPIIAIAMVAVFTVIALLYYFKVVRVNEHERCRTVPIQEEPQDQVRQGSHHQCSPRHHPSAHPADLLHHPEVCPLREVLRTGLRGQAPPEHSVRDDPVHLRGHRILAILQTRVARKEGYRLERKPDSLRGQRRCGYDGIEKAP